MASPRVSVVIPTFNRAAIIGDAVESVLAQSYRDLEVLIVDDGSTDDTPLVIQDRFGRDPRVSYLRRTNGGPGPARNDGIRRARGELIAFLDSDDLWHPDNLGLQIAQLDSHPEAVLSFCDAQRGGTSIGPGTRFQVKGYRGDTTMRGIIEGGFPMCTPSVVIRRSVFEELGMFDESLACNEDWDLWIRIVARYPVLCLDRPLITVRRSVDSISQTRVLEKWRSGLSLWERYRDHLLRAGCPPRLIRGRIIHAHKKVAQTCRAQGRYPEARAHYLRWWLYRPWQIRGLLWWAALSVFGGSASRPAGTS